MKTRSWRDIRARKFPPEELQEIDRAVVEESWIVEAQRRANDLATGKVKGVPVEEAPKTNRSSLASSSGTVNKS